MEAETIGLGFNSRGGSATGMTSFVSASASRDVKDERLNDDGSNGDGIGIKNSANNVFSAEKKCNIDLCVAKEEAAKEDDDGFGTCRDTDDSMIKISQQQQYNQQWRLFQPPSSTPPSSSHPTIAIPPPLHHSISHDAVQQRQQQSNISMAPPAFLHPPPLSVLEAPHPLHYFPTPPPPPLILQPNANVQIYRRSLPSFQPPSGPPPAAVPSPPRPPTTSMTRPVALIPQPPGVEASRQSFAPPPTTAPSMRANGISSQHPHLEEEQQKRQQQQEQQQQQQQQQNDSLEKARAIAMRFLRESSDINGVIEDPSIANNVDYAQRRRDHFENERRRLRAFTLKNLEYVMKREENELRRHVEAMNQMTAYEEKQVIQLQLQHQQQRQSQRQLEQKNKQREQAQMMNEAGNGIGTKEQRRAEWARKRQRSSGKNIRRVPSSPHNGEALRSSLYLTNLPVDGLMTERSLQSLFRQYGRLDRVTMYRNRLTGELKGDGLVVFGQDAAEEHRRRTKKDHNGEEDDGVDLVEAVCMQMNGAELPCGTVIGVQPANMDYKKKERPKKGGSEQQKLLPWSKRVKGIHHSVELKRNHASYSEAKSSSPMAAIAPNAAVATNVTAISRGTKEGLEKMNETKVGDEDDDLDDFFASLK